MHHSASMSACGVSRKYGARHISSEQESVFPVVLGDMFHVFILLKKGVCDGVFFLLYNKLGIGITRSETHGSLKSRK